VKREERREKREEGREKREERRDIMTRDEGFPKRLSTRGRYRGRALEPQSLQGPFRSRIYRHSYISLTLIDFKCSILVTYTERNETTLIQPSVIT
jgi:hypothetical protein